MYKQIEPTLISLMVVREASGGRMNDPTQVHQLCKDMNSCAQEQFVVLTLDTKNELIERHMVGLGTLNSVLVHPREVFRPAISDSAANIILVHNHPSGDPSPSSQDIQITKKLIEAGRILGIEVLDHVIIGRRKDERMDPYLSLRESGLVEF